MKAASSDHLHEFQWLAIAILAYDNHPVVCAFAVIATIIGFLTGPRIYFS